MGKTTMRPIGREIFTGDIFRLLSCFALASALVPALAQTPAPPSAPDGATTKVFISNLTSQELAPGAVGPGWTYNQLYAAMQNLAPYQVVMDPAQADLIFEIRYKKDWLCSPTLASHSAIVTTYADFPRLGLTISDRKTHVVRRFYETGLTFDGPVVSLLKNTGLTGATIPKRPAPAPVPPQISAARSVYLSTIVRDKTHIMTNPGALYDQAKAGLEKWGRYKLVERPADAELIMELAFTERTGPRCPTEGETAPEDRAIELKVVSPGTNVALWEFNQRTGWIPGFFQTKLSPSQKKMEAAADKLVNQLRRFADRSAIPGQPKIIISPDARR
jgi:hypothetical protein